MANNGLVNLAGRHAFDKLSATKIKSIKDEYDSIEHVEFTLDSSTDILDQLKNIFRAVDTIIDGTIPMTFILPEDAYIAIPLYTFMHGIFGGFPNAYVMKEENEQTHLQEFDVNGFMIRDAGRAFRGEIW